MDYKKNKFSSNILSGTQQSSKYFSSSANINNSNNYKMGSNSSGANKYRNNNNSYTYNKYNKGSGYPN